jgi:SAM-dependent methyltransferase
VKKGDCNLNKDGMPWYDDKSFWRKMRPFMFSDLLIKAAPSEVDALINLLEINNYDSILDLSCGIGRHTNEFARRGYSVTGVDITQVYLNEAREIAKQESLQVEYVEDDMRVFRRPDTFDVILSMYTSFGFFEDDQEQLIVLDNVFTSLKDRGRFLIETIGKERLAKIFQDKGWQETDVGVLLTERQPIEDWGKMQNFRTLIEPDGTRHTWEMTHHLYSAVELKSLLESAGFLDVRAYGNYDGSSYDHQAERLLVVGEKRS